MGHCHGHLGVENLNVVRAVGSLLDHGTLSTHLPLVKGGDLVPIVRHMTLKVMPQKLMLSKAGCGRRIRSGKLRVTLGLNLGRRHQSEEVMDVWRVLVNVRSYWYHVMLQLQRFMVAARVSVNHDEQGGTAPDLLVWDRGGLFKR